MGYIGFVLISVGRQVRPGPRCASSSRTERSRRDAAARRPDPRERDACTRRRNAGSAPSRCGPSPLPTTAPWSGRSRSRAPRHTHGAAGPCREAMMPLSDRTSSAPTEAARRRLRVGRRPRGLRGRRHVGTVGVIDDRRHRSLAQGALVDGHLRRPAGRGRCSRRAPTSDRCAAGGRVSTEA